MTTQAQVDYYEMFAAAASVPRLLALLRDARAALPAEFCGFPDSLAGRIDDVLHTPVPHDSCDDLVLEELPSGEHAWLRRRAS